MESLTITVLCARLIDREVHAIVRAEQLPRARIHLRLTFPVVRPTDIWAAARDEALRFLDPA